MHRIGSSNCPNTQIIQTQDSNNTAENRINLEHLPIANKEKKLPKSHFSLKIVSQHF